MKRFYQTWAVLFAINLALALVACATYKPPQTPQQVINEAKETVLSVKRTINQNLAGGFYTADQAEKMLDQAEAIERDVKTAEGLLLAGKSVDAGSGAAAARSAIMALRTQVEKK